MQTVLSRKSFGSRVMAGPPQHSTHRRWPFMWELVCAKSIYAEPVRHDRECGCPRHNNSWMLGRASASSVQLDADDARGLGKAVSAVQDGLRQQPLILR
ncbi:MAG: hypothetical protein ACYDCO_03560 [Armatimonadota bacterium]